VKNLLVEKALIGIKKRTPEWTKVASPVGSRIPIHPDTIPTGCPRMLVHREREGEQFRFVGAKVGCPIAE